MLELALLAFGVALGGALGWAVARVRMEERARPERDALRGRLAAADALADELRKLLSQRDLEKGDLQSELDGERARRAQAETRWEEARRSFEEARAALGDTFKAISADALRASQSAFLEMADARLSRREQAVDASVKPLQQALERYEALAQALEASRREAYGGLEAQLRTLAASSADLKKEAGRLVTALRSPHIRGQWGEVTLRRVVELAGLTAHVDYAEQVTVQSDDGRLRPDMVIHLPSGRDIVVDAKVPLSAFLEALEAETPEARTAGLVRHAAQMRQHMGALAAKAYWDQFAATAEMVVMFIPGESFVSAAAQADPTLIEEGMAKRVVVATPTTLIGLLLTIAHGWRQERLAANAAEISEQGREVYRRLASFLGHLDKMGGALRSATNAFNNAVGSLESRVLPAARRFHDLGAASGEPLPSVPAIEQVPRQLAAPEYPQQLSALDPPEPGAPPEPPTLPGVV